MQQKKKDPLHRNRAGTDKQNKNKNRKNRRQREVANHRLKLTPASALQWMDGDGSYYQLCSKSQNCILQHTSLPAGLPPSFKVSLFVKAFSISHDPDLATHDDNTYICSCSVSLPACNQSMDPNYYMIYLLINIYR